MQREVGIDERIVTPAVQALPLDGLDPNRSLAIASKRPAQPDRKRTTARPNDRGDGRARADDHPVVETRTTATRPNRAARRAHLQPTGQRRRPRRAR
jgi:hypothetical protein